jgi:arylsulfatase
MLEQLKRSPRHSVALALLVLAGPVTAADPGALDRSVLPIAEPARQTWTELDVRKVQPPPRFEVKAPEGAPNVVIVLVDDLGMGAISPFGGPITTPTLDGMAEQGLRFNRFHTTALCSPTRAALKSGRNHHSVNMGFITELATSMPGNTGKVPADAAPLAEILRQNGYSTAAFGKWHETAAWEVSASGPFDRWPTHQGFDKFYGFLGGETNQWAPALYDGVAQVHLPEDPDYHFMTDMTEKARAWIKLQKALTPDRPAFVYFAPGAVHAPHHVPKEWIARWKGKFDQGWDKIREETLARQIRMGVVPKGTRLAPRPPQIPDWKTLSADEKRLFARQAEVFAAFVEYTDHEIGRMLQAFDEVGQRENTLVIYIAGDNGTSGEGGRNGVFNEMGFFNGVQDSVEFMLGKMDEWGGPNTFPHMSMGWAQALNAPFGWMKQVSSDPGGTQTGMVIHWPKGIQSKNGIRPQFAHVIDIAPTVLEAAGLPAPTRVNGVAQIPMHGASLVYAFEDAKAPERRSTQYFEIAGNRAIYHQGWYARTIHRAPWETKPRRPLQDDSAWELFNLNEDFSLSRDLAKRYPEKLAELKALFLSEASKYGALPMDDRTLERFDPVVAGRPDVMGGRTSLTLAEGVTGLTESAFINIKNRSKTITAELEVPADGGNGAIIVQGGRFGGWALYVKDGVPAYDYNFLGQASTTVAANRKLPAGKSTLQLRFDYDGGGPAKGGLATLLINGEKVGEGRIERTQPSVFSADDTADVGIDLGTPVVPAIGSESRSRFTGRIPSVTIETRQ